MAQEVSSVIFLVGGSLIGQKRNKPPGPFQWDDDVDLAVVKDQ